MFKKKKVRWFVSVVVYIYVFLCATGTKKKENVGQDENEVDESIGGCVCEGFVESEG